MTLEKAQCTVGAHIGCHRQSASHCDWFRFVVSRIVGAAFGLALLTPTSYAQIVATANAETSATSARGGKGSLATKDDSIRPFHVSVPEEALVDLRRRLEGTRWPERESVSDATQGVQLATMQKLAHYWATDYDWRKAEARLNALPQFVTTIDGLDIHFIHVRSKNPNALPLIVTHGWPGSIIEQLKIIGPITDPTAYGGKAEDAFDVYSTCHQRAKGQRFHKGLGSPI